MKLSSNWPSGRLFELTDSTATSRTNLTAESRGGKSGNALGSSNECGNSIADRKSSESIGVAGAFVCASAPGTRLSVDLVKDGTGWFAVNPIGTCSGGGVRSKLREGGLAVMDGAVAADMATDCLSSGRASSNW